MSAAPKTHLDLPAMALMTLLCASWGLQQVTVKIANAGISPVLQAGLRSIGAALLLWAWCAFRKKPLFEKDGTLLPGLSAGLLFAGEFALIYWGLLYTSASRAVIFLYLAPFLVAGGLHFLTPAEKIAPQQWAGFAGAFLGILLAFSDRLSQPSPQAWIGDLMLVAAAAMWGATTVTIKATKLARISASKTLFYQLAASAVVLPPLSFVLGETGIGQVTPLIWLCMIYQTVWVAFVSYLAWFWLVSHYPAGRLSAFSFLTPLFGLLAGAAILGEPATPMLLAALALVAGGIYLVNRPRS